MQIRMNMYFSTLWRRPTAYDRHVTGHAIKTGQKYQIKSKSNQNQIKIYIAPYVHEDSEALGGWITCSRRVGIDEFLNVF